MVSGQHIKKTVVRLFDRSFLDEECVKETIVGYLKAQTVKNWGRFEIVFYKPLFSY